MFHQGRILCTSLVSLIMTLVCLDPSQWSLMSLINGNKVKKNTSQGIVKKKRTKPTKRILRSLSFDNNGLVKPSCGTVALYGPFGFFVLSRHYAWSSLLVKSKVNGIFLSKTLKCFAVSEVHFLVHKMLDLWSQISVHWLR